MTMQTRHWDWREVGEDLEEEGTGVEEDLEVGIGEGETGEERGVDGRRMLHQKVPRHRL